MRILMLGSTGTDVMEVQATLRKIGYRVVVSGIYDEITEDQVKQFQRTFSLVPDGIIGPHTWRKLERFLLGYDTYVVRPGDTIDLIAKRFGTRPWRILAANEMLRSQLLMPGRKLIIPYDIPVVDADVPYDPVILNRDLMGLKARYSFLETGSIGKSVLGRELPYLRLGYGPHVVMYNGAHHALEWITSLVLMKFIEDILEAYVQQEWVEGYDIGEIWRRSSIYLVPMVNPDGIDLVIRGLQKSNPFYEELLQWNGGSEDFSKTWQANIHGVDLNHNYDAKWEEGIEIAAEYGITGPGPTRFGGPYPESEPEVQAMVMATRKWDPSLVLAYHSQGEVIYWDFDGLASQRAKEIGMVFSKLSGYRLDETYGLASYSGYKDWFIQEFRRPGYTVEVGKGRNPLPLTQFPKIYQDNLALLLEASMI